MLNIDTLSSGIRQLINRHGEPRIIAAASFIIQDRRRKAGKPWQNVNLDKGEFVEFFMGLSRRQVRMLGEIAGALEMNEEPLH